MRKLALVFFGLVILFIFGWAYHKNQPARTTVTSTFVITNQVAQTNQDGAIVSSTAVLGQSSNSILAKPPVKKWKTTSIERGVHFTSPPPPTQGMTNVILFRSKSGKTNGVDPRQVTVIVGG